MGCGLLHVSHCLVPEQQLGSNHLLLPVLPQRLAQCPAQSGGSQTLITFLSKLSGLTSELKVLIVITTSLTVMIQLTSNMLHSCSLHHGQGHLARLPINSTTSLVVQGSRWHLSSLEALPPPQKLQGWIWELTFNEGPLFPKNLLMHITDRLYSASQQLWYC